MRNPLYILAILTTFLLLPACSEEHKSCGPSIEEIELHGKMDGYRLLGAMRAGDLDKVKQLIANGASLEVRDEEGYTALQLAAVRGLERVLKLLLDAGADIKAVDESGLTALHLAVIHGALNMLETLLERGMDIDAKDNSGRTALHLLAQGVQEDVVEFLIEKGADINAADDDGQTPLDLAMYERNTSMANLLRTHGGKNKNFRPNVALAAYYNDVAEVKELLEAGGDANATHDDWTALHYAAAMGSKKLTQLLIDYEADVNARESSWSDTPLHLAVRRRHRDLVQLLLTNGADIDERTRFGFTPLHIAADFQDKEMVLLLIAEGANVNAKDRDGKTPLDWARAEEMKKLLCSYGAVSGKEFDRGEEK